MDKKLNFEVTSKTKGFDEIDAKLKTTSKSATNLFSQISLGAKKATNALMGNTSIIEKTTKKTNEQVTAVKNLQTLTNTHTKTVKKLNTLQNKESQVAAEKSLQSAYEQTTKSVNKRLNAVKKIDKTTRNAYNKAHAEANKEYAAVKAKIALEKQNLLYKGRESRILKKNNVTLKEYNDLLKKGGLRRKVTGEVTDPLTGKTLKPKEITKEVTSAKMSEDEVAARSEESGRNVTKNMLTETDLMRTLSADSVEYNTILQSLNMTKDREGNLINKTTKKMYAASDATGAITNRYSDYAAISKKTQLPVEQLYNKMRNIGIILRSNGQAYDQINKKGLTQTAVVDRLNKKYQQFNMNALGIMFFGMSIAKTFNSMLSPAMQASGAMENMTFVMQDLFAPAGDLASSAVGILSDWVDNRSEGFKTAISAIAISGSVLGTTLSAFGQFALGWGAIRTEFPGAYKAIKKLAGWMDITKIKTNLSSLATWINTKLLKKNTEAVVLNSTASNTKLLPSLGKARVGMMSTSGALYTMILPLLAVIAVVYLFSKAWSTNFMGIRQITGKVLNGIVDGLKIFISWVTTGIIGLANIIKMVFNGITKTLAIVFLGLNIIAKEGFNLLVSATQVGLNALIGVLEPLIDIYNAAAKKLGKEPIKAPSVDLSSFKASTTEAKAQVTQLTKEVAGLWDTMVSDTVTQSTKVDMFIGKALNPLYAIGDAAIASGDRFDLEKAQASTAPVTNNTFATEINVQEISSDMDVNDITNQINTAFGKLSDQGWNE